MTGNSGEQITRYYQPSTAPTIPPFAERDPELFKLLEAEQEAIDAVIQSRRRFNG